VQRVKKMAVKNAYMDAFSKILLIVLSTGKATAAFQEVQQDQYQVTKQEVAEAGLKRDVDSEWSTEYGEPSERPWVQ